MSVALIAHQYPPAVGGVERHVAELAQGFVQQGIAVEVITCDPTRRLPTHALHDGVLVHRFPTLANDGVFYVSPQLSAWLLQNAHRFTLLHAHSYHTPLALQALIAARWARVPFVLTAHYHGTGHSLVRRALHIPYRAVGSVLTHQARPLICVSQVERALLERHFGQHLDTAIVPNGVDVEPIRRAEPLSKRAEQKLVVVAGRLEHYKQIDRVIEAVPQLPDDYELIVIGNGPAHDEVFQRVTELHLSERVRMLGYVPTPMLYRWLRTADVFVSLSQHEAFGITLLEAAVAGARIVASDIPAHREVAGYVSAGRVSFIRSDCSAAELADDIKAACQRTNIREADFARVPTWRDTVERTLACYDAALNRSQQHTRALVFVILFAIPMQSRQRLINFSVSFALVW